ncbi:breast cancer type 1 susceptibility-like protein [Elysia marginata]|uniref:Breast cancer type 1 susceptibility-like protein n=1 Tax=Elysia marginata TaxID=1093978 RepID=A0AAV4IPB6_9GAST|nr:breast cancer type 1 susceptibility-like protein [Elysia marginata]
MTPGDIYGVAKRDKLILSFGAVLIKKLGKAKALDISQRMRQLGRLTLKLLEIDPRKIYLQEFISGESFDTIIKATEELCEAMATSDGRRAFKMPSLATRLGYLLAKIGNVKRGCAIRHQNEVDRLAAETFLSLLKSEWTHTVSSCALNTLSGRKDHQVQVLPLTEDLVKVRQRMQKEMEKGTRAVLENREYSSWRKLAQTTMSRLILFTKGEEEKFLVSFWRRIRIAQNGKKT